MATGVAGKGVVVDVVVVVVVVVVVAATGVAGASEGVVASFNLEIRI